MEEQTTGYKVVDSIDMAGTSQTDKSTEETEETSDTDAAEATVESEEDVTKLPAWAQERINKAESERSNLSQAVTRLNKERKLSPDEEKTEEKEEEDYPDWDETSKKFQKQTLSEAEKIAGAKAQQIVEKTNERVAINQFVQKYPELAQDANWNEVIANYTGKNGKGSPDDIVKDLERAYILTRYDKGEIGKVVDESFNKGKLKGQAEAKAAELNSVSSTSQKSISKEGPIVSENAIRLAERMRVDPKRLAAEDDSLTATIKM